MAKNKVVYGGVVLIDLTADKITAGDLVKGNTAHNAAGQIISGALPIGLVYNDTLILLRNQATVSGTTLNIPRGKASVSSGTLYI